MAVPISKNRPKEYNFPTGELYFPRWESDSTDRHKPAEQNPYCYSVKTEAGKEIIIIRIKHHERFIHLIHIILRSY